MIVNNTFEHLKKYKLLNLLFFILFVIITSLYIYKNKDYLASNTNIFTRSNLFYNEIIKDNKRDILENLKEEKFIDTQYDNPDIQIFLKQITIEEIVVRDSEKIMNAKYLQNLFVEFLLDRVEFNQFLNSSDENLKLVNKIGKDLSKKFRNNEIDIYGVFFSKIVNFKMEKNNLTLTFNSKNTNTEDIKRLQDLYIKFNLNNFDRRLQSLFILNNKDQSNEFQFDQIFYHEHSSPTSLLFSNQTYLILYSLIYFFLTISANLFLFFFKK